MSENGSLEMVLASVLEVSSGVLMVRMVVSASLQNAEYVFLRYLFLRVGNGK